MRHVTVGLGQLSVARNPDKPIQNKLKANIRNSNKVAHYEIKTNMKLTITVCQSGLLVIKFHTGAHLVSCDSRLHYELVFVVTGYVKSQRLP